MATSGPLSLSGGFLGSYEKHAQGKPCCWFFGSSVRVEPNLLSWATANAEQQFIQAVRSLARKTPLAFDFLSNLDSRTPRAKRWGILTPNMPCMNNLAYGHGPCAKSTSSVGRPRGAAQPFRTIPENSNHAGRTGGPLVPPNAFLPRL